MDYIMQIVEELSGKLQQLEKEDLIKILKHHALYDYRICADLQLRLCPPDEVLKAALRRIRASFEPCYQRGKHCVRYNDVYEALFGANAVLMLAADGTGFARHERMLMCFAVLEEMGRIWNSIDDSGEVGSIVDEAMQYIVKLAGKMLTAERNALLEKHFLRGTDFYAEWPDCKEKLLLAFQETEGGGPT